VVVARRGGGAAATWCAFGGRRRNDHGRRRSRERSERLDRYRNLDFALQEFNPPTFPSRVAIDYH